MEIQRKCTLPLSGFFVFAQNIRRKTGIADTRSPEQCRAYLQKYAKAMAGPGFTKDQVTLARLTLGGHTTEGKAHQIKSTEAQVIELIADLYAKAAIYAEDPTVRKGQLKTYLAAHHPENVEVSMDQMVILNYLAQGKSYEEIGQILSNTPANKIRRQAMLTCIRLGLNARGNGVQRNLIRKYLAKVDADNVKEAQGLEDLMDDPMF